MVLDFPWRRTEQDFAPVIFGRPLRCWGGDPLAFRTPQASRGTGGVDGVQRLERSIVSVFSIDLIRECLFCMADPASGMKGLAG